MESVSLYRKYRPQNFDNLIGQDHIRTTLVNALKSGRIAHAYLFSGPRGTGKTSTARLMAKAINCSSLRDGFEPCEECEFCKDLSEGRLIDVIEIDAASNRGIDEVRDLNEKIRFAPTRAKSKIYIIDEVHMMTREAFNALLKTLEEPPEHAYFVLATTEIHKIPETIISRCQRFDFKRIASGAVVERLKYIAGLEGIEAEEEALEAISKYSEGGLRDAIGLMEQLTVGGRLAAANVQEILGLTSFSILDDLLAALTAKDVSAALKLIHSLHDQGSDLKQFTHEFVDRLRQELLLAVERSDKAGVEKFLRLVDVFQEAQQRLNVSSIPQLPLEIAVILAMGFAAEKVAEILPVAATKAPEAPVSVEAPVIEKAVEAPKPIVQDVKEIPREHKAISGEITIATIKENWARVIERIKNPGLRMSVKNGVPVALSGNDLRLEFSTSFYRNQVMEGGNHGDVESVMQELFNHPFKIVAVVKALDIKPVVEEEKFVASVPASSDELVDTALDIFGGEVVE